MPEPQFTYREPLQPPRPPAEVGFAVAGQDDASGQPDVVIPADQPKRKKRGEKPEPTPEELAAVAEFQQLFDRNRNFLQTYAGDRSLTFKAGTAWFIDLETGEVNVDIRSFMVGEKRETEPQILWSLLHEIEHFRDLRADPKGMQASFEGMRREAKTSPATALITEKYRAAWADKPELLARILEQRPIDPKKPEKGTISSVENTVYRMLHLFDNIFDDRFVNTQVQRRASVYAPPAGNQSADIRQLYTDKLFQGADYSKQQRHLQLVYTVLRELMVPDEAVTVSDEVQEVLDRPIRYLGKMRTVREIAASILPQSGRETKKSDRAAILGVTIKPLFMELLMKDLEEWNPGPPPEPQTGGDQDGDSGQGEPDKGGPSGGGMPDINPFSGEYDKFDENSPDQLPDQGEGGVENFIDKKVNEDKDKADKEKAAAAKKAAEDAMTPAEKAEEAKKVRDRAWREREQIPEHMQRKFEQAEASIQEYLDEFTALWSSIVYGQSREMERAVRGPLMTGDGLRILDVISNWGTINAGKAEEAPIWEQTVLTEHLIQKPEQIRVRVVVDISGSMDDAKTGKDEAMQKMLTKREAMQQVLTLLLSSLTQFETLLNLTRSTTQSNLHVDTQAWTFGSDTTLAKPLQRDGGPMDLRAASMKAFAAASKDGGGTNDALALETVLQSMKPGDREAIESQDCLDICFVITDGGSQNPVAAREQLDALAATGMVVRGLQIGQVSADEARSFNAVWKDEWNEQLGAAVPQVADLLPVVAQLLYKYLSKIQL